MDVTALADAKFQLAGAVRPGGRLILNADDPEWSRAAQFSGDITWFGLEFDRAVLDIWFTGGSGRVAFVERAMVLARNGILEPVWLWQILYTCIGQRCKVQYLQPHWAPFGLPMHWNYRSMQWRRVWRALPTDTPDENPGRSGYVKVGGPLL
jgi:hypothetical protein